MPPYIPPPRPQSFYAYIDGEWAITNIETTAITIPTNPLPVPSDPTSVPTSTSNSQPSPTQLQVLTWNVDAFRSKTPERTQDMLNYICSHIDSTREVDIIFFQEVNPKAIPAITTHEWVRQNFYLTDISNDDWRDSVYGNITFIRRSWKDRERPYVPTRVFRSHYPSFMSRDALAVDLTLPLSRVPRPSDDAPVEPLNTNSAHLRVINVHLESLISKPPFRPRQLHHCAELLQEVGAGYVAGDFNGIEDFDETLIAECNLRDVWTTLRAEGQIREEDSQTLPKGAWVKEGVEVGGQTWGLEPVPDHVRRFPAGRLDRIAVLGMTPRNIRVLPCVTPETESSSWWSDHCGLLSVLELEVAQMESTEPPNTISTEPLGELSP
ncbi:hypothetical protein DL93DRAFT_2070652 [Clavulina sp. PMI_390]|nr:hypothetical protein DL93DRAFT_2070652 [Clavulina sp. PMI_390]